MSAGLPREVAWCRNSVALRGLITVPEQASLEQLAGALHAQLVPLQDGPLWARPSTGTGFVVDDSDR